MANRRRSVLVMSDQVLFRQTLSAALRDEGFQVTDQTSTAPLRIKRPDIALLDLEHAPVDTSTLVDDLHDQFPDSVLVLLGSATRIAASVDGHGDVEVELDRADLTSLKSVLNGRSPTASNELAKAHKLWRQITPRQREVLRWLGQGLDNPGIGAKLRVGVRAIKAHISALLALFGFDSRTQLALCAVAAGLRPV